MVIFLSTENGINDINMESLKREFFSLVHRGNILLLQWLCGLFLSVNVRWTTVLNVLSVHLLEAVWLIWPWSSAILWFHEIGLKNRANVPLTIYLNWSSSKTQVTCSFKKLSLKSSSFSNHLSLETSFRYWAYRDE